MAREVEIKLRGKFGRKTSRKQVAREVASKLRGKFGRKTSRKQVARQAGWLGE